MYSSHKASQLQSNADDNYEMADPQGMNRVDINANRDFDMRKYKRHGDSPSVSSGSEDGVAGIMKTTNVSVRYTGGDITPTHDDSRSHGGKHSSVDSLV